MFTDVDVSWPGSIHDSRVFRTSDLFPLGEHLCQPYYIVADSAYPSSNWVITPFRNNGHLDPIQVYFNTTVSKTRVKSENSFALLEGRFRRLRDYLDRNNIQDICETVVACCTLHNICLFHGGDEIQDFMKEGRENAQNLPMEYGWIDNNHIEGGFIRRNELMQEIWNNRRQ
ncbi:hypothetical protein JTB14_027201 [Gonioctena quinquepunctata]|nr:hypothetical protein JTB14_027201 [Gonioctena quinquepunctata]